jgi:hypothetical protein
MDALEVPAPIVTMPSTSEAERIARLEAKMQSLEGWVKSIDARLWLILISSTLAVITPMLHGR